MAMFWNRKTLLAKIEATYGTDSAPVGTTDAVLATNVRLLPMEGEDVSRELDLPLLGGQATVPAGLHAKLSFEVELAPSGAVGTVPAWGPLLRMCAVAQTVASGVSVTYNPISTGHESGTIHFNVDGTRYALRGCRGNAKLIIGAQRIPRIQFEMTGLFLQPAAFANPAVTLAAWQRPQIAASSNTPTCTFNGVSMVLREFEMDLGNDVQGRFLIGSESILIPRRAERISATVQAVALATLNPYALAAAQTPAVLQLVHGTGAGRITTLNVPNAQLQRPAGLAEQQGIVEWPLNFLPLPGATGNDQWTIVTT